MDALMMLIEKQKLDIKDFVSTWIHDDNKIRAAISNMISQNRQENIKCVCVMDEVNLVAPKSFKNGDKICNYDHFIHIELLEIHGCQVIFNHDIGLGSIWFRASDEANLFIKASSSQLITQ